MTKYVLVNHYGTEYEGQLLKEDTQAGTILVMVDNEARKFTLSNQCTMGLLSYTGPTSDLEDIKEAAEGLDLKLNECEAYVYGSQGSWLVEVSLQSHEYHVIKVCKTLKKAMRYLAELQEVHGMDSGGLSYELTDHYMLVGQEA